MRRKSPFLTATRLALTLMLPGLILLAPGTASAQEAPEKAATALEEVAILKTNHGDIVLRFFSDVAPEHVKNFKFLASNGIYDGVKFHRVIPGFMIQAGDPNSKDDDRSDDGMGGAGPGVKAEFSKVPHRRGVLSMARKGGDFNSATSQFFILVGNKPGLDGDYSAFGMVVEGMDVADAIVALPRDPRDNPLPANPAIIESVVLEERSLDPRPSWSLP